MILWSKKNNVKPRLLIVGGFYNKLADLVEELYRDGVIDLQLLYDLRHCIQSVVLLEYQRLRKESGKLLSSPRKKHEFLMDLEVLEGSCRDLLHELAHDIRNDFSKAFILYELWEFRLPA